jgi:excisionase family DNA binding protein
MSKTPADWISISEAAELLASSNVRFTPGTIGRWARTGQLQSIKVGNRRFVRRAQVRSLLRPQCASHSAELQQQGLFEDFDSL